MAASQYKVATGSSVALVSLALMVPQPTTRGIQFTERSYGAGGAVYDQAPYCELLFSFIETEALYATFLAQFGLASVTSAPVTVYIRNERLAYARYNATAVLPSIGNDGGWSEYFMRNVVVLLKNLVAI